MRGVISIVGLVVAALFLAPRAGAQQVRGVVTDSVGGNPIPGAVVSTVTAGGATAARTISDASGRFTLPLGASAVRLHAIRIGYAPRDVPLPASGATAQIAMGRIPAALDAMRVTGKEMCPGSADRGPAYLLWEQARAGLLATVVAREANPADATSMTFKRHFDVGDEMVRRLDKKLASGTTSHPFVASASAAEFARTGYMAENADGRVFYAPDADVLLDESFAGTHCFHLTGEDANHKGQIGLAFTPARDSRDTTVDVRGVIWIDRAVPSVRSLDFVYTALERPAQDHGAGGHIEFVTVANGISFVERWTLRLVDLEVYRSPSSAAQRAFTPRRREDRLDVRATRIEEDGGQVLRAEWPDGTKWSAPETGIRGRVVWTQGSAPVPHAIVALDGYADSTTTDSTGAFSMIPLVPGRYRITAADTSIADHVTPRRVFQDIDIPRDRVATVNLKVPPLTDILDDLCKDQRRPKGSTAVVGRMLFMGAPIPRDATVVATWPADFQNLPTMMSDGSAKSNGAATVVMAKQSTTIDERGRFVLCGVSINRPVQMRLEVGGARMADTTVYLPKDTFNQVEWRVPPP